MQKLKLTTCIIGLMLFSASCGTSSKKETDSVVTDKKVELEKLKTDKAKTEEKIKALEAEIAKLDTGASSIFRPKLRFYNTKICRHLNWISVTILYTFLH